MNTATATSNAREENHGHKVTPEMLHEIREKAPDCISIAKWAQENGIFPSSIMNAFDGDVPDTGRIINWYPPSSRPPKEGYYFATLEPSNTNFDSIRYWDGEFWSFASVITQKQGGRPTGIALFHLKSSPEFRVYWRPYVQNTYTKTKFPAGKKSESNDD